MLHFQFSDLQMLILFVFINFMGLSFLCYSDDKSPKTIHIQFFLLNYLYAGFCGRIARSKKKKKCIQMLKKELCKKKKFKNLLNIKNNFFLDVWWSCRNFLWVL